MNKNLIILILIGFTLQISAQDKDSLLFMHHYEADQGLMLKWIPTGYDLMVDGFKQGYNLYRAEVKTNSDGGERLQEFIKLNKEKITYWPVEKIADQLKHDSALITPALFFGSTENLFNEQTSQNAREAKEKAEGKEFKLMWGALEAVKSNHVADAMGLYYLDKNIDINKKYVYKLELIGKPGYTRHIIVFPAKNDQMDKVMGMKTELEYGAVTLSWFNNNYKDFVFFDIYRSLKPNRKFEKLNDKPFTGVFGDYIVQETRTVYTDSFPEYNETYYYKVIGTNAFGAEGIPSDVIEIDARYKLKHSPFIKSIETLEDKDIKLEWTTSPQDEPFIKGYAVYRANSGNGDYKKVHDGLINPRKNNFVDKTPKWVSNYYKVCAYAEGGDSLFSLLKYHGIIDSIPPSPPRIKSGICDTTGIITLSWNTPPEDDVKGYRIFKTYDKGAEPIRLLPGSVADTSITDTISLNAPYNHIYYRVSAIDLMANPSPPSDYFEVDIPDMNPPSKGFIRKHEAVDDGISLHWRNSSADDLKCMYLLRKKQTDLGYDTVLVTYQKNLSNHYLDKDTKPGVAYTYTLVTQDKAGLFSDHSNQVTIKQPPRKIKEAPENLQAFVSAPNRMIKLVWDFNHKAEGFRIYRSEDNGELTTYTFVAGTKREFYDKELKPSSTYQYVIVAELPGHFKSAYSNSITVKY